MIGGRELFRFVRKKNSLVGLWWNLGDKERGYDWKEGLKIVRVTLTMYPVGEHKLWQNGQKLLSFKSLSVSLRTVRFNIQKFYMVLALCWVFCADIRTDSDLCRLYHKLNGFYNRGGKCLLRGTDRFLM